MFAPSVLSGCDAGQEAGERAGVVAAAVAEGGGIVLRQAAQDQQVFLEGTSGSRMDGKSKLGPFLRASRRHVRAVGDVDEGHALRERRAAVPAGRSGGGSHRLQPRKRDRRAQAAKTVRREMRAAPGHGSVPSGEPRRFLERLALHDLQDEPMEAVVVLRGIADDPVDRAVVIVFDAPTECEGEHLLGRGSGRNPCRVP